MIKDKDLFSNLGICLLDEVSHLFMLFNFSLSLLMFCQIDLLVAERGLQMWLCIFISFLEILIIVVLCIFILCF